MYYSTFDVCQTSWQPRQYSVSKRTSVHWNSNTSPGIQLLETTPSVFYLHYNLKNQPFRQYWPIVLASCCITRAPVDFICCSYETANTLTFIITATVSTSQNYWSDHWNRWYLIFFRSTDHWSFTYKWAETLNSMRLTAPNWPIRDISVSAYRRLSWERF